MFKESLINFSWLLLIFQFIRGTVELFNLRKTFLWLDKNNESVEKEKTRNSPFFFVLLPVLREQKVIVNTIKNFLVMDYPQNKFKIIIITTQKEIVEKEKNKEKLESLASDLTKGIDQGILLEKYLGLFDEIKLKELLRVYKGREEKSIYVSLLEEFKKYSTTIELVQEIAEDINQKSGCELIIIVHYPEIFGTMAHQVNYATKRLIDKYGESSYIALYNADSRPNTETFKRVAVIINKTKGDFIIQQSAIFTKNFNFLGHGINALILKAGGLFQTQWTLCHEIPRLISQLQVISKIKMFKNKLKIFFNAKLVHCVGHGMFIKLSCFKKLGYFPLETKNEDLPFGFKACTKNIPIIPLSVLEMAETPATVKYLINQKKVWYWSYLDYLKCRKMALDDGSSNRVLINSLTVQGLWNGFVWFISSLLFLVPLTVGLIFLNKPLLIVLFLSLLLFHYYPFNFILFKLNKLQQLAGGQKISLKISEFLLMPTIGLVILFTDSVGPWLAAVEKIKFILTDKISYKQKTER